MAFFNVTHIFYGILPTYYHCKSLTLPNVCSCKNNTQSIFTHTMGRKAFWTPRSIFRSRTIYVERSIGLRKTIKLETMSERNLFAENTENQREREEESKGISSSFHIVCAFNTSLYTLAFRDV